MRGEVSTITMVKSFFAVFPSCVIIVSDDFFPKGGLVSTISYIAPGFFFRESSGLIGFSLYNNKPYKNC